MATNSPEANYLRLVAYCNPAPKLRSLRDTVRAKLIALDIDPTGDFGDYMPTDPDHVPLNIEALEAWVNSIVDSGDLSDPGEIALNNTNTALLQRFASCLGVSQAAPALDLDPLT